jgi:hypothetical protein
MAPGEMVKELLRRWEELRQQGQLLSVEELCADCPELVPELKQQMEVLTSVEALRMPLQRQETRSYLPQPDAARNREREIGDQTGVDQVASGQNPSSPKQASTLIPASEAGIAANAADSVEGSPVGLPPVQVPTTAPYLAAREPKGRQTLEEPALARGARTAGFELPAVADYDLVGVLGHGGMGVVYKANQISLPRPVALKMIKAAAHAQPEEPLRFRSEAEAVARLQHPNIVQIYEVGEQNGLPYFSLEYVEGGSLASALNGTPEQPLPAAQLMELLARAIHVAHQRGIIHRDLKPANVLLTADRVPKITDFGLAKRLDVETGQTQSGAIMGTPP